MSSRKHVLQQRLSCYASTSPDLNETNGERYTIVGKPKFVVTRTGASTVISPLMTVVTPVQVFRGRGGNQAQLERATSVGVDRSPGGAPVVVSIVCDTG